MAQSANGKQLKATLRFNVNGTSKLTKVADQLERINRQLNAINSVNSKAIANGVKEANQFTKDWNNSLDKSNKKLEKSKQVLSSIGSKLKGIVAAYLGVMGMKALITTSDTITSAENKFNYLNGGDTAMTQETLDKIYVASQSSRSNYTDMLNNVGKLATLAGDAFGNDMDNIIKFQEIMAKNYALGGASAAEQSSSMYQLVQALGAGQLMGDELRSVREGAPLAAKQIEKLAQKIYNTTDSLKEMGSQGLITSDIVVQAILSGSDEIDAAFEKTKWTFKQAWINIKNTAIKTFEPVMQRMNYWLNEFIDAGGLEAIGKALSGLADIAMSVVDAIGKGAIWIVEHLELVKAILFGIGAFLTGYLLYHIGVVIYSTITGLSTIQLKIYACMAVIAITIGILIYLFDTAQTGVDFLVNALSVIAVMLAVLAVITGAYWLLWIAGILGVATIIFLLLPQILGGVLGLLAWIGAAVVNLVLLIDNLGWGLLSALTAIAIDIGVAFVNGFYNAKAAAWDFVKNAMGALLNLVNKLNDIIGVFGLEIDTSGLENAVITAANKAEEARSNKLNYEDVGEAFNKGAAHHDLVNMSDAFDGGFALGESLGTSAHDWVNDKFNSLKLPDITAGLPDVAMGSNLPGLGSLGSDLGDIADNTGDTAGNTGSMADTMQLAEEDLEYLRALANAEWKKEFTTANIVIDMNNTNTINNSGDLDGWVTQLTDKLYEELQSVADGVYV